LKKYIIQKTIVLLLILITTDCTTQNTKNINVINNAQNNSKLKIATFNMQIFGTTKINRPKTFNVFAQIATNYDIIALQEVGSNKSTTSDENCNLIMDTYIQRINEIKGGEIYSYIRGNQYAIVYRNDRIKVNAFSIYKGTQVFAFMPLIANFETINTGSNFDFSIITIHTSPKLAEDEIPALRLVINEVKNLYSEPDVLCVGDYNADGDYYNEGDSEWLSGFNPELYITGIPNSYDTTVAPSSNTYDRIQMTKSLSTDYSGNAGIFEFGKYYNISECEGGKTTAGTEKAISDHYPVWCEFYIDKDTD